MVSTEIIAEIRNGSLKAFEVFFGQYYIKVRNFADGMVKNMDDAENIAQNVFMKIWLNREQLSSEKSVDSYVFTIARNEIYDFFRDASYFTSFKEKLKNHPPRKAEYNIDSEYNIKEIKKIVDDTVAQMPDQRRQIFRMSRYQFLSNDEISEKLGISKRTVEKHISLALKMIRKNLGEFLFWIFTFFIF